MSFPAIGPLSEAELDQLSAGLAGVNRKGTLNLEALGGFFCALIASPRGVSPSEYLPIILGGEMPSDDGLVILNLRRRWYQVSVEKGDELVAVCCTVRIVVLGDSLIRVRQQHERRQHLFILKLGE